MNTEVRVTELVPGTRYKILKGDSVRAFGTIVNMRNMVGSGLWVADINMDTYYVDGRPLNVPLPFYLTIYLARGFGWRFYTARPAIGMYNQGYRGLANHIPETAVMRVENFISGRRPAGVLNNRTYAARNNMNNPTYYAQNRINTNLFSSRKNRKSRKRRT